MVDQWIKYMPDHPDYIIHAIQDHFKNNPLDKPLMWPRLAIAYRDLGIKQ